MHEAMFQSSDVLTLFATPVWELQLPPARYRPINEALLALTDELRSSESPLPPHTVWQSRHDLHHRPELAGLVNCIHSAVERTLSFLRIGYRGIEITGCWVNLNPHGTGHRMHSHPNNYLSGVYYVRTPAGADSINFHDPRVQAGIVRPPVTALTAHNTDMVVTRVREGRLLLFPAWLQHSVDPSGATAERVSVSFNLMFTQFGETMTAPLW